VCSGLGDDEGSADDGESGGTVSVAGEAVGLLPGGGGVSSRLVSQNPAATCNS